MYGDHNREEESKQHNSADCFDEKSEFRPMSPYAVSKVAAYHACSYYKRVYNV